MPSNSQLNLMTNILRLEGFTVIDYQLIEGMGIVLSLEKVHKQATCIYCGSVTRTLHQNNELTVRDLPWGEEDVYLKINRRQMRCEKCKTKFTEELSSGDFIMIGNQGFYVDTINTNLEMVINQQSNEAVDLEKILLKTVQIDTAG